MGKKKPIFQFGKDIGDITATGIGIGTGSLAIGAMPTTPATANIQTGFTTASRFLSPMVSVSGAGAVFGQLEGLEPKKKKRRK